MKNRSVQAIAIGLSVMSLAAGPVGMTAYAYAAEMQNETEIASEQDISGSEEEAITSKTEQNILEESTDEKLVDSLSAVIDTVDKEDEAPSEDKVENKEENQVEDQEEKQENQETNQSETIDDVKDDSITEPDAATVIAGADKTIEEARTALDEAESRYIEAIESYDAAKAAIDESVSNSGDAAEKIRNAEDALTSTQKELDTMAGDIELEKEKFIIAVVDNIPSSVIGPVPDEKELVETVLSSVEIKTETEKCIELEYDSIDETGEVVHCIVTIDKIDNPPKRKGLLAGNKMAVPSETVPSLEVKSREMSFKVVDNTIWKQLLTDYLPYIKDVKAKYNAYNEILESIKVKQADLQTAQDLVTFIKSQIEALEAVNSGDSAVTDQISGDNGVKVSNAQSGVGVNNIPEEVAEKSAEDVGQIAYNTTEKSSVEDNVKTADNNSVIGNDSKKKLDKIPFTYPKNSQEIVIIDEENVPLAITLAGMIQHAKWFIALGGVSLAGVLVSLFEVKRRAATKIIDKLNQ